MKNLLYILLLSPMFFISSCEEETQSGYDCISNTCTAVFESPQYLTLSDCQNACSDNNQGSCVTSLPISQTIWEVVSINVTDNNTGITYNEFPGHHSSCQWTFEDDSTLVETTIGSNNNTVRHTSVIYTYYPENCEIDFCWGNCVGDLNNEPWYLPYDKLTIIEHTSNTLVCEYTYIYAGNGTTETTVFDLERVN